MSQENVEIVKKLLPPVGTDYKEVFGEDMVWATAKEAFEPHFASDFEGAFIAWGQQQMEFKGLDGLRDAFLDWLAPWARYYDEIEDVFAVGDDRVVVLGREHGYRLDTGAEVEAETAGVYSCATARSRASSTTRSAPKPSKPSDCRSKTLTPTPPDLTAPLRIG